MSQEDMINITSCGEQEFASWMRSQYTPLAFEKGYKMIKDNFDLIHQEDGEEQLASRLMPYFADRDQTMGFINFVTTFLIVQNMNFGY
jgi:predicted lipoprotein with Yx(FWY)xxD motif